MSDYAPKYSQDEYGYNVIEVYVGDKQVHKWHECALYEYPEDLTWSRMISGVFADGFKAGKDLANEQSQAEITRLQQSAHKAIYLILEEGSAGEAAVVLIKAIANIGE